MWDFNNLKYKREKSTSEKPSSFQNPLLRKKFAEASKQFFAHKKRKIKGCNFAVQKKYLKKQNLLENNGNSATNT